MAVVINDFEVVHEAPANPAPAAPRPAETAAPALDRAELERAVRELREAAERLWAH